MMRVRPYFTTGKDRLIPDSSQVAKSDPQAVKTYSELVTEIAWLSNTFPHQLLFFRGQTRDHKNKEGSSTLYPEIYRGDPLRKEEIIARFDVLESASMQLVNSLSPAMSLNRSELRKRKYIQWSILQHYNVCATPLLDITQSLRVACSFALRCNDSDEGFVYVLGLPFITNRISMNTEEDILNVRLLSICPAEALRPHHQEGYVVGTLDTTTEYESKTQLDFNRRLVRKYSIPNTKDFWQQGSGIIPDRLLFPDDNDSVLKVCREITEFSKGMARPGDIGLFIKRWARLEATLQTRFMKNNERTMPIGRIIHELQNKGHIDKPTAIILENLRTVRNKIVHRTDEIKHEQLVWDLENLTAAMKKLDIPYN